jgi:ATP-dependent phosphofructokinase / diphosphate-dependent phosphofructokinase
MPSALLLQGGGPTPVLNASLYGVWDEMRKFGSSGRLWGSRYGLKGLLTGAFLDLTAQSSELMAAIRQAPGAALGSSREPLAGDDFARVLEVLRRQDIHWVFFNGGNGSMGTALELQAAAVASAYELQVMGIPKTVDNDLFLTDHTPGYASAGRFWAHAVRDMGMDHRALPSPIVISEVIGRNVGWVVAATVFARHYGDDAPHLIYCPERPLPRARLLADIEKVYRKLGRVFVCLCEGQLDENGNAFDADVDQPDNPRRRLASNLAHAVARFVTRELGLRARSERPSLLGRSCSLVVPENDRSEAEECGRAAVRAAAGGELGQMVALRRESSVPYVSSTFLAPLEDVARRERQMPAEFLCPSGHDVTAAYLDYARPLIGTIVPHARFSEV